MLFRSDIDANTVGKAFELLVSKDRTSEYYGRELNEGLTPLVKNGMKGKAAITAIGGNADTSWINATNESGEKVKIHTNHAYTLKAIDMENVTLINPHDTSHTIKIPTKQYGKVFNTLSVIDVSYLSKQKQN